MRVAHGRVELELHELAGGKGTPLLLLHALYGSSADWGEGFASWSGPVFALDLAGHGSSAWIKGHAYTAEILAVGVDAALDHIGSAALVGAGVGAYIALLIAGARRSTVSSSLLLPGVGLAGHGPVPVFSRDAGPVCDLKAPNADCDPHVAQLDDDIRPLDYAEVFARRAARLVLLEDDTPRPPWWQTVRAVDGVVAVRDLPAGLRAIQP